MQPFVFQALSVAPDGTTHMIGHEGTLHAHDLEAAIVTGHALLEVIPTSQACNVLCILDASRHLLWRGPIEGTNSAHRA